MNYICRLKPKSDIIIYTFDITRTGRLRSPNDDIELFREACARGHGKNVIVVTTFWDAIIGDKKEFGNCVKKEAQVKGSEFLGELEKSGAKFYRCGMTQSGEPHSKLLSTPTTIIDDLLHLEPDERVRWEELAALRRFSETRPGGVAKAQVETLWSDLTRRIKALDKKMTAFPTEVKSIQTELEALRGLAEQLRPNWLKRMWAECRETVQCLNCCKS